MATCIFVSQLFFFFLFYFLFSSFFSLVPGIPQCIPFKQFPYIFLTVRMLNVRTDYIDVFTLMCVALSATFLLIFKSFSFSPSRVFSLFILIFPLALSFAFDFSVLFPGHFSYLFVPCVHHTSSYKTRWPLCLGFFFITTLTISP